jgi:hypothetical protein
MNPLPFVVGAYAVILGGLGAYVVLLWRRLAAARRTLQGTDEPTTPRDAE